MRSFARVAVVVSALTTVCLGSGPAPEPPRANEELQLSSSPPGVYGGHLVIGQRSEPKTLNPVTAADTLSREVIGRMMADLLHINRATQQTEPALAKSWKTSQDGRTFTLALRKGIRFSDGQPFDADDVMFSFQVYLDEKLHSPQRDLLVVAGKPISVTKVDQYTVRFGLAQPYAAAERIFDGIAMLPKHRLAKPYTDGRFSSIWTLNTPPAELAGLGPYRLKHYIPGQRIVLERNRYYWRIDHSGQRLPYLDELVFLFVGTEDAQLMRFEAGETDLVSRLGSENYALLARQERERGFQLADLGPSLEYNFLVFNLNDLAPGKLDNLGSKQAWFRDLRFRAAVSCGIDREGMVRLVYSGRGAPLWGNVSPGNKVWANQNLPHAPQSLNNARHLLKSAGFSWRNDGRLLDPNRQPVEFSIVVSSTNAQRMKMATMIQGDLGELGMEVNLVPLDFRAMLDRLFQSYDYEAAVMGLGGGDADPNPEMNVWLSNGSTHLWHLGQQHPATDWERELDQLMQEQMVTLNYKQRKRLYDRVQEIIAQNLPFVFLCAPDVLTAAQAQVGNFHPAVLDPYTLWNSDELYLKTRGVGGQ